ncbi:unnamed protein product [[Candida] boidinii]|uniref:Unnamed protein product n=1 Tax=Candida boidinii TaxID=5477 RepID=A0A9W6T5X2_CANBO|nr:unnamed protein product [[Candida] boidinii]GMF59522.1 unnamed protein product [[Candida] boidinii]GMG09147.1 unnamed protein product [[Candida] boidinii]
MKVFHNISTLTSPNIKKENSLGEIIYRNRELISIKRLEEIEAVKLAIRNNDSLQTDLLNDNFTVKVQFTLLTNSYIKEPITNHEAEDKNSTKMDYIDDRIYSNHYIPFITFDDIKTIIKSENISRKHKEIINEFHLFDADQFDFFSFAKSKIKKLFRLEKLACSSF